MKRLLNDGSEIEETETLIAYLKRKLEKQEARLAELKVREKRDLVLVNLFNCYQGENRQAMLMLPESEAYEYLLLDLKQRDEIVSHRLCTLTYCAKQDEKEGQLMTKLVRLQQDDVEIPLQPILPSYLRKQLRLVIRAEQSQSGEAPREEDERQTQVVLIQALTEKQAAQYWKGPHDCLVSVSLDRVASEFGEACGWFSRHDGFEDNDPARYDDPELSRDDWLARYAHFSPRDGLWFCKRTWAQKGEKVEI